MTERELLEQALDSIRILIESARPFYQKPSITPEESALYDAVMQVTDYGRDPINERIEKLKMTERDNNSGMEK